MIEIVVLGGGISNEREVSLRSSAEVVKASEANGFKTKFTDPKLTQDFLEIGSDAIVLPILHGTFGEDGELQKLLESRKIAFLGSSSKVSKLCFNKEDFKKLMKNSGILTPDWEVVQEGFMGTSGLTDNPFILKPISGGSSIDTFVVREGGDIDLIPDNIFQRYDSMLVEELIIGTEITIGILDGKALPVIEIIPPENEEFDYENKYNGKTKEICPAVSISPQVQQHAQRFAEKIHKTCGARHMSRIDIMVTADNDMYVLELNTVPGMTNQSLFPKASLEAGLDMPDLVKCFYDMVKRDYLLK